MTKPRKRSSAGPVFNMEGQTVRGNQTNVGRDLHNQYVSQAITFADPASAEALAALKKEVAKARRRRDPDLVAIENEFGSVRELERYYVVPDLQEYNPPDELNDPSLTATRESAFKYLDRFVRDYARTDDGSHCLFILGDAGMGKTSLLAMTKYRQLCGSPPTTHDLVLLKLGPETLDRIAAIPDRANTVLLLDSLDEDPAAHAHPKGAEGRLAEILNGVGHFHRVLVTCRTQYFPEGSKCLSKAGHFVVGGYECPLKYMSLFSEEQVARFLALRFPASKTKKLVNFVLRTHLQHPQLAEASQAAAAMQSLKMRPLLLSYIDDFVAKEGEKAIDFTNRYLVHRRLIEKWLLREQTKHKGLPCADGWRLASALALHLARQGERQIERETLRALPELKDLEQFHIEARSLLNRTEDFRYQFAHRSIQEFLLAHALIEREPKPDLRGVALSPEALGFLCDGKQELVSGPLDLRGARFEPGADPVTVLSLLYGIEMVYISPGTFLMGSPADEPGRYDDEGPRHRVEIAEGFWLGATPVTQAQYRAVTGASPSSFRNAGPDAPVEQVSWDDCQAFVKKLNAALLPPTSDRGSATIGFRLPSEAEWEYACRAGTETALYTGPIEIKGENNAPALDPIAWYGGNSGVEYENGYDSSDWPEKQQEHKRAGTHPVGQKEPNAWGLYDMLGNVWEWCEDHWHGNYDGAPIDGRAWLDKDAAEGADRVFRGGSWNSRARHCRCAYRLRFEPEARWGGLGFRLVLARSSMVGSGRSLEQQQAGSAGR